MYIIKKMIKAQQMLGFFILIVLFGCKSKPNEINVTGFTMGTTYSVKIINDSTIKYNAVNLKNQIDSVLVELNQQMSTYIEDSEISKFNSRKNRTWQMISFEFLEVLTFAQRISELTKGAFDVTVGPLVNIWGFGTSNQIDWEPPRDDEIKAILSAVGYKNIEIKSDSIRKLNPATNIDLNAIAKGFGVDVVHEYLTEQGFKQFLVEIGGEVSCSGGNQSGMPWKVGIDRPIFDTMPGSKLHEIVELNNSALATSGDYRNYFYYNDNVYSHTIDPRTGYPIEEGIAAASVIAPNCMMADALATALMVIGSDGIDLIEKLENVETMLVERLSSGDFKTVKSSGWPTD